MIRITLTVEDINSGSNVGELIDKHIDAGDYEQLDEDVQLEVYTLTQADIEEGGTLSEMIDRKRERNEFTTTMPAPGETYVLKKAHVEAEVVEVEKK